jgi:hypothetical protein
VNLTKKGVNLKISKKNYNSITGKPTKSNYSYGHFELTRNPLSMLWSSESMETLNSTKKQIWH